MPDIVVANQSNGTVATLASNGSGTLQPAILSQTGFTPFSLQLADFDRDARPDVVTINTSERTVLVRFGRGDGTFDHPLVFSIASEAFGAVVGDVDGDDNMDIVVSARGEDLDLGPFLVLLGNGNRAFQPMNFNLGTGALDLALGDFNGDADSDLVTSAGAVALSRGDGTFEVPIRVAVRADAVAIGDFNRDGWMDAVTTADREVQLLLGRGEGKFQEPRGFSVGTNPNNPRSGEDAKWISAGDVNLDERLDVITLNRDSKTISVLLGDGLGGFATVRNSQIDHFFYAAAMGDVDSDGRLDVISDDASLYRGRGDGFFGPQEKISSMARGEFPTLGDINDDGIIDLVSGSVSSGGATILLGNGNGSFRDGGRVIVEGGGGPIALADFNDDGNCDLVTGGRSEIGVALGNENGTFQKVQYLSVPGNSTGAVAVIDVDRDGRQDIATVGIEMLLLILGNGDGTFQPAQGFAAPTFGGSSLGIGLTAVRLNRDPLPDILLPSRRGLTVFVARGEAGLSNVFGGGATPTSSQSRHHPVRQDEQGRRCEPPIDTVLFDDHRQLG